MPNNFFSFKIINSSYGCNILVVFIATFSPAKQGIVTDLMHPHWHVLMIATWKCVDSMRIEFLPKLLAIPYQYFLLKSLLTTSLAVLLQLLFQNYLSILIAPSKCLRNVHLLCKCNIMFSSNISVRFDSSKFWLVIWKRTKDKEEKDKILTQFTTMVPVHSRLSRGKKIKLFLTDTNKQKPKLCTNNNLNLVAAH